MVNECEKHVLIVEDAPDLQYLLGHLFLSEGYRLSQAYNGEQALQILRSMTTPPSFILLDIMMPVMDGFEFREHQMSDPQLARIPVVVMTADGSAQEKVMHLGVRAVIQKPIQDLGRFFEMIAPYVL